MDRYARQIVFSPIGKDGQEKLNLAKVAIIGVGALGTVAANNLCRSGIGYLRIIDRDYVEITNLQRQVLFIEEDALQTLPKAIAATNHLQQINSQIIIEPIIADVNSSNIERFIQDMDLVIDATDNIETRLLVNEACHSHRIPWIYAASLGSEGMTMNFIWDEKDPCLRCFINAESSSGKNCSTHGVLNMITSIVASLQTAEALKIILGSNSTRKELLSVDIWESQFHLVKIEQNETCPVCVEGRYEFLGKAVGSFSTTFCGNNSIQVLPPKAKVIDFPIIAKKLEKIGAVSHNSYSLKFTVDKYEFVLFQDGRAIIKNALDTNHAKSLYTEYLG